MSAVTWVWILIFFFFCLWVQAKSGSFDRNVEFLNLLPKRGPNAFSAFCEALRETQQQHLEAVILKTMSTLSHEIARVQQFLKNRMGGLHFRLGLGTKGALSNGKNSIVYKG